MFLQVKSNLITAVGIELNDTNASTLVVFEGNPLDHRGDRLIEH